MSMTISQCLRRIAAVKGELKEFQGHAYGAVSYNVDEIPAYTFSDRIERVEMAQEELIELNTQLLLTNAITRISFENKTITLSEAALRLKEYKSLIAWYGGLPVQDQKEFVRKETDWDDESNKSKIVKVKHVCHFTTSQRDITVRSLRQLFAALNDVVEKTNQNTQLSKYQDKSDR